MIYDKLCHLTRYRGISSALDCGIDFLRSAEFSGLCPGRISVDGDRVFGNHFSYRTAPRSAESLFESHRRYLDLHVVLQGAETLAVSDESRLQKAEEREAEDAVLYTGVPEYELTLEVGKFILVFPGEAHLPKLVCGGPELVDKLVLKIAW